MTDSAVAVKKKLRTKTWAQRVAKAQHALVPPEHWTHRYPPRNLVEKVLKQLFSDMAEEALHGGRPGVPGFGTFRKLVRKTRQVMNPATREMMQIPKTVAVGFRCAKAIKR